MYRCRRISTRILGSKPVVVASVPRPQLYIKIENIEKKEVYTATLISPEKTPNYRYAYMGSSGPQIFVDHKDGRGWVKVISAIVPQPEYLKATSCTSPQWVPYKLSLKSNGLDGFSKSVSKGKVLLSRAFTTSTDGSTETFQETWSIPTTPEEFIHSGPKAAYSMTNSKGIVSKCGGKVKEGLWRMKLDYNGIQDITRDKVDIRGSKNWPITGKAYDHGAFTINVDDFDNQFTNPMFTYSEYAKGKRAEVIFYNKGTTGKRIVDPTVVTSNISTGWYAQIVHNLIFDGTYYYVFYTKGSTSLYAKEATSISGLASASEQTVINGTMDSANPWNIFQVDDTKFDIVYLVGGAMVVRTCTTGSSISCSADSAATPVVDSGATIYSVSITRSNLNNAGADRMWLIANTSGQFHVYYAGQVGVNSNGITSWTSLESGNQTTPAAPNYAEIVGYGGSDAVVYAIQRNQGGTNSDGITIKKATTGGATQIGLVNAGSGMDNGRVLGTMLRVSDTDFRFTQEVVTGSPVTLTEYSFDGNSTVTTLGNILSSTANNPSLMYDRQRGDMYAFYVDGSNKIQRMYHPAGGSWGSQTEVDNSESDANSLPTTNVIDAPQHASRTTPRALMWGYLNANSTNYDVLVGGGPMAPTVFNQRQGVIENTQNNTVLSSHTANIGERLTVKIQVDVGDGIFPVNKILKLQYDKNDGTWVDVKPAGEIRSAADAIIRDSGAKTGTGEAGTCTAGTTPYAGWAYSNTARTTAVPLKPDGCYDISFVVDTINATAGTTYRFRLYNLSDNSVMTSYAAYPSFTTVTTLNNVKRYSKSNTASLPSAYSDLKKLLDSQGYSNVNSDDTAREILQNVASDTTADVTTTGEATSNNFGYSVASAGDVNGDGYDDIIIGSYSVNKAYIFYGGPSMDATADVTMNGTNERFGYSVASAGDVNGDGYADVIVGEDGTDDFSSAFIYYGGPSMDATADVTMDYSGVPGQFGYPVASAGDVNGDGYDDVIVGKPLSAGSAYIFYGGRSMDATADVILNGENSGDNFGISVASAGDVNGDGYGDVIVGADGYNSHQGRAYIFYGGPSMAASIAASSANVIMTGASLSYFGISVASAGDVNGDGYSDVIVGSTNHLNGGLGDAYIYYGGTNMNNTSDVTLTDSTPNNEFGISVASAGDVNGDGYGDVIVGAWNYSGGTGRAYIYYGGSSMDATADVIMTGGATGDSFGYSVASAGDVNGDGYSDVIVGAFAYSSSTGRAYIYLQAHNMNTTANKTMTGQLIGDQFGYSVASAGDVNGDGYADVIVGADTANIAAEAVGKAYIFYGGPSMDTTADVTIDGGAASDFFGASVASAGDVNGDGYSDVIVGADGNPSNTPGKAYIYYGGSSMDSTADVTLSGTTITNFGTSVASAGDVNGDGYADVIVGDSGFSSNTGRAYIFYGGASMASSILASSANVIITGETTGDSFGISVASSDDVNGDGYSDVIVGADTYSSSTGRAYIFYGGSSMASSISAASANVIMTGSATSDLFGYSVASAGDVNGDGYSDVIVGSDNYYNVIPGQAFIYYGGPSMDNTADVTLNGESNSDEFGKSVASAGDVNGDGYSDVIVGATRGLLSGGIGRVYIYYGGPSMDSTADVTMNGENSGDAYGFSVSSAGDVNGDGYADVIVGADTYSSSTGRAYTTLGGGSAVTPVYQFATKASAACSTYSQISATWNGQSTIAASSKNIVLQAYRFGTTNAWETVTTENTLAANTDGNITGSVSTNTSEYCDGSNWSYWRVYQVADGTNQQILKADQWSQTFTAAPTSTPTPTPASGTPMINFNGVNMNGININ